MTTTPNNNVKNIYSPAALEIIIDDCRSRGDWDILLQSIERYAHIFDAGVAGFTKQHTDLTKVRAYYWVCMAQYIYSQKKDFVNAVDCVRRALAIESTYIDIKIVASCILLKSTSPILSLHTDAPLESEFDVNLETFSFELPTVLGDLYFKDFVPAEQSKMLDILLSKGSHYKNAFLGIIGCFDNVDVSAIFKEALTFISENAIPLEDSLRVLVLISSRYLLKAVHLVDILDKYQEKRFTDYRLWLWIDSISTRAVINELLNNLEAAKLDNLHICRHILHNNDKSDIIIVPTFIPSVSINQSILALSRLPLIARNSDLEDDFYKYLLPFTSPQSPLRNIAPIPLLIGIIVEAALCHLNKAIKCKAPLNFYLSNSNSIVEDTDNEQVETKEPILSEIDASYDFFDYTKRILSLHVDSGSFSDDIDISSRLNINIIYPTDFSQLKCLQYLEIGSDPITFIDLSSSSLIATFMVAILKFKKNYNNETIGTNFETIIGLYEWAVSQEVTTDVNILWNLSLAYDKSGKIEEAKILQKQCEEFITNNWINKSNNTVEMMGDVCNKKYSKYIKLLRWLGLEYQPFEYYWLPSVKYLEISLSLENYNKDLIKDLLQSAKNSIFCLYKEKGIKYLNLLEKDLFPSNIEAMEELNKKKYLESSNEELSDRYANYNSSRINTSDLIKDLNDSIYYKENPIVEEGIFHLLFLYAKTNQIYARLPSICDYDKERYRILSLRIFTLLKSTDRSNFIYRYLSEDFILHYAISLAELRDFSEAKNIIRNKLQEEQQQPDESNVNQSRLIHLLCLILSVNCDEPTVNSTSVALCRKAIQINKYDLHLKLTRSYLEFNAGDSESCVSILDQIVSEVTADYELLKSEEKLTSDTEKKNSSFLTPVKTKSSMMFKEESPHTPDINEQISLLKKPLNTRNKKYLTTNSRSSDAFKTILNNKRSLTSLLIGVSRLYKSCGKLSKAKSCLENAWMYLFLLNHDTVEEMKSLARGECGRHRAIDILTQVPTLLGWRLPDACGWAAPHFIDCESDILAEYASVVQKEEGKVVSLRAIELYQLALTIHPENVRSLIALSHIEFQKYKTINNLSDKDDKSKSTEESNENKSNEKQIYRLVGKDFRDEENDKHLQSALYYSKIALSLRELNSDSWFVHGLIQQHFDKTESAMDAYLTAEECRQYCPIRPFASVLMN